MSLKGLASTLPHSNLCNLNGETFKERKKNSGLKKNGLNIEVGSNSSPFFERLNLSHNAYSGRIASSNTSGNTKYHNRKTSVYSSLNDSAKTERSIKSDSSSKAPFLENPNENNFTVVMKFGGSSVASADRMKEVASLILKFPEEKPVIVLSAMGKTTNNLLEAGNQAVTCGAGKSCHIQELKLVKDLHLKTVEKLGVDEGEINELLEELSQLLTGIALMKEMTNRTMDYLVSFGERLSTRIFSAYLNKLGIKSRQYDAPDIGFFTTDEFTNSDVLDVAYPSLKQNLLLDFQMDPAVAIVTGFIGKGIKTGATTTLGRGGSDLTATVLGKALGLREIQVWKDVDGVLTCDPRIYADPLPVPFLTFEEASELAYFGAQVLHPQSMRPAREADIPVRVKNSYNPDAAGTLITGMRDLNDSVLTSIVLKSNVTMLDIVSLRMLGQFGFLSKVFSIFEELGISVDVVATSEVSISLTLDPAKMWSRELIQQELDNMVHKLESIALVKLLRKRSIISLIGNVQKSSFILEKVFRVLRENKTNVQMISQGASKVNISLVVDDAEAKDLVRKLHVEFFGSKTTIRVNGSSVSSIL